MKQVDQAGVLPVSIRNLSRQFGDRCALDDVSVTVEPGKVLGVVGENGAGKTTLIKHILGMYRAQAGVVEVFGLDPVKFPEQVLGKIGYLSEDPDLPGWMSIDDLMSYSSAFYPTWDDAYARQLVTMFELDTKMRIRELSKGKRARVGLCVAQAHRPQLLLLDEPSSGLDPIVRRDILEAIIRTVVDEGRTVIFSSHLLEEVERVSDNLLMLSHGQMMLSDSLDNVLAGHFRVHIRGKVPAGLPEVIAFRETALGECRLDGYGDPARLLAQLQAAGVDVVSRRSLALSEIFMIRSDLALDDGPRR